MPPRVQALVILALCSILVGSVKMQTAPSRQGEATTQPILRADFNAEPAGWAKALLDHPRIALAPGAGPDGDAAIRVEYVGYEQGSRRVVVGYPLPAPGSEMTLTYDVKFEDDFQFVRGGKLHGLGPERPIAGGNPMRPDGWSARVTFAPNGGFRTYLYTQDKNSKYGVGQAAKDFRFEKNRYYRIAIHVRVNSTADATDGFTHVYVDGKPMIRHDNVRFRGETGNSTLISRALFSTFHGGHDPTWSPIDADGKPTTVHTLFANLAVYAGRHVPGEAARQH